MADPNAPRPTPLHDLLGWKAPAAASPGASAAPKPEPARPRPAPVSASSGPRRPSRVPSADSPPGAPSPRPAPRWPDAGSSEGDASQQRAESPQRKPENGSAPGTRWALIDGSNVAHNTEGERPRLANILLVRDKLAEQGYEPIIVVDAALRHQIDDAAGYERLVDAGDVRQAPAGTDADYFILSFARELDASIVSNDQFRDRSRQFAAVRNKAIRYMIVANEVVFEKRTGKRRD